MPHDRKGNLLEAGDLVMIPARVTEVMAGEEYCNVTVELEESMPPYDHKDSYTLNTKQVELVRSAPSAWAAATVSGSDGAAGEVSG